MTATLAWESKSGNGRFGNGRQMEGPNWFQIVTVMLFGSAVALFLLKRWNLVSLTTAGRKTVTAYVFLLCG